MLIKINLKKFKQSKLPLMEQFVLLQAVYEENYQLVNYMFENLNYSMDDFKVIQSEFPQFVKVQGDTPEDVFIREEAYQFFNVTGIDTMNMAIEMSNLFPARVKTGGYPVKSHPRVVDTKLKKFVKEFSEFSKETILEATKSYVDNCKKHNWAYMQALHYYVYKNGVSTLASDCLAINDRTEEEANPFEQEV